MSLISPEEYLDAVKEWNDPNPPPVVKNIMMLSYGSSSKQMERKAL